MLVRTLRQIARTRRARGYWLPGNTRRAPGTIISRGSGRPHGPPRTFNVTDVHQLEKEKKYVIRKDY